MEIFTLKSPATFLSTISILEIRIPLSLRPLFGYRAIRRQKGAGQGVPGLPRLIPSNKPEYVVSAIEKARGTPEWFQLKSGFQRRGVMRSLRAEKPFKTRRKKLFSC